MSELKLDLNFLGNKNMKYVINLFGGPGCGKTTIMAGLYYIMSLKSFKNFDFVQEYIKELVYEQAKVDNFLVFSEQYKRIKRIYDAKDIEYVITDGPLINVLNYATSETEFNNLEKLVFEKFNEFNNINFFIERDERIPFQSFGRWHNKELSVEMDKKILKNLKKYNVGFTKIPFDQKNMIDFIIDKLPEIV